MHKTRALQILLLLCVSAEARGLEEITGFGANPGGLKMFRYVPAGAPPHAPLVVALHGCGQGAADYVKAGWNALADQRGFHVLYPEETSQNNALRCFRWFEAAQQVRGQGENASIAQMIARMKSDLSIDPARVFVTGLSAGAAETMVLLATWPELFAGGAPIAGVPFGCATDSLSANTCMTGSRDRTAVDWGDGVRQAAPGFTGLYPRLSVWQGDADATVAPVNADEIVSGWLNVLQIAAAPSVVGDGHLSWDDRVESWRIPKMGHGTPVDPAHGCGTAAPYLLDVGLCSSARIADFFGLVPGETPPQRADGGAMDAASPAAPAAAEARPPGDTGGCAIGGARPGDAMILLISVWILWSRRRRV